MTGWPEPARGRATSFYGCAKNATSRKKIVVSPAQPTIVFSPRHPHPFPAFRSATLNRQRLHSMIPMKTPGLVLAVLGLLIFRIPAAHAQGFSGNINGTPGIALPVENLYKPVSAGRTYTDLELTSLTRAEEDTANQAVLEGVGKLVKAANDARAALVTASLTVPTNAANLETKAKALADAETALANARATTLAPLVKKILPKSDEAKIRAAASTMETRATARAALAARAAQ